MQIKNFTDWSEFKENKLAAKQASNMYSKLMVMWNSNSAPEEFQAYYKELQKSHLYVKHGALYCQVLSDFVNNRKVKEN